MSGLLSETGIHGACPDCFLELFLIEARDRLVREDAEVEDQVRGPVPCRGPLGWGRYVAVVSS